MEQDPLISRLVSDLMVPTHIMKTLHLSSGSETTIPMQIPEALLALADPQNPSVINYRIHHPPTVQPDPVGPS